MLLSIFLYACEAWTLTAELQRKIQAVEMRSLRRLLGISYTDHITNDEVRRRVSLHMNSYVDLLTTVKKRKLKWYGHITRTHGLSKTILQGTVPGSRKRGRQKKRWIDNITDWTVWFSCNYDSCCRSMLCTRSKLHVRLQPVLH